jgi:hypothetical protein
LERWALLGPDFYPLFSLLKDVGSTLFSLFPLSLFSNVAPESFSTLREIYPRIA